MLYLPDFQWATIPLFFLSAIISVATQPAQRNTTPEDIYWNIVHISPAQIPLAVISNFLRFASLRVLNVGSFHICMTLTSQLHIEDYSPDVGFAEEVFRKRRNKLFALARWGFFLAITVPLCVGVFSLPGIPWIKFWAGCFSIYFVFTEICSSYISWSKDACISINKNWPNEPLMTLRTADKDKIAALQKAYQETQPDPTFPQTLDDWNEGLGTKWSSCEAVGHVVNLAKEGEIGQEEFGTKSSGAARTLYLKLAMWNHFFVWNCGHARCLIHKILVCSVAYIAYLQIVFPIALVAWLMHVDLRYCSIAIMTPLFKIELFVKVFCILWMIFTGLFSLIGAILIVNVAAHLITKVTIRGYRLAELPGHFIFTILKIVCIVTVLNLILYLGVGGVIIRPMPTPTVLAWPVEAFLYGCCIAAAVWVAKALVGEKIGEDQEAPDAELDVKDGEVGNPVAQAGNAEQEQIESSKDISHTSRRKDEAKDNDHQGELYIHVHILLLVPAALFWYSFCFHHPEIALVR